MREMDRRSIEGGLVPGPTLMERAGAGCVRSLLSRTPDLRRRIWIVYGKGNNGGDGLVIARLLRERGLGHGVLLAAPADAMRGDALEALEAARRSGLYLEEVAVSDAVGRESERLSHLGPEDIVVDALLGTGLTGPVEGT